jgi:hypothetical protein
VQVPPVAFKMAPFATLQSLHGAQKAPLPLAMLLAQ